MDVAGFVFSTVSVVESCLTFAKLVIDAKEFPRDCESLRLDLANEHARLRTWAREWELPVGDNIDSALTIPNNTTALFEQEAANASFALTDIESTLRLMLEMLLEGSAVHDRHQPKISVDEIIPLRKKIGNKMSGSFKRIIWIVADKGRLENLVTQLKGHNDKLDRIRPRQKPSSLQARQMAVNCQFLETVENLTSREILAGRLSPGTYDHYPQSRQFLELRPTESDGVALIRAQDQPQQTVEIKQWGSKILKPPEVRFQTSDRFLTYYCAVPPPEGSSQVRESREVMVEWKYYSAANPSSIGLALDRVRQVVQKLSRRDKPPGFRILDCVGYFQDDENSRFGVVYEMPIDIPSDLGKPKLLKIRKLSNLFASSSGRMKPSLGDRFVLAKVLANAMLEFHLSRWFHKNFNSENVVFFLPEDSINDFSALDTPYVASFGLARPVDNSNESEPLSGANPLLDFAYQHPTYENRKLEQQASEISGSRFHRAFDVYSLGCVLLEVAVWKSLRDFGWNASKYREGRGPWRKKLVDFARTNLPFMVGSIYADVVIKCLEVDVTDGDSERESEQVTNFCWGVMRRLDSLRT